MKVDWSAMTPQEAWDALTTAPKVAGPWTRLPHARRPEVVDWRRRGVAVGHGESDVAEVWHYPDESYPPSYNAPRVGVEQCASVDDGKTKADAALREAGWVLVERDAPAVGHGTTTPLE